MLSGEAIEGSTTVSHHPCRDTRKRERNAPRFPLSGCEKYSTNQVSRLRIKGRSPLPPNRMVNQATLPFLQPSAPLPQMPAAILSSPGRPVYGCEISRHTPLGLSKAPHRRSFVFEYLEHR